MAACPRGQKGGKEPRELPGHPSGFCLSPSLPPPSGPRARPGAAATSLDGFLSTSPTPPPLRSPWLSTVTMHISRVSHVCSWSGSVSSAGRGSAGAAQGRERTRRRPQTSGSLGLRRSPSPRGDSVSVATPAHFRSHVGMRVPTKPAARRPFQILSSGPSSEQVSGLREAAQAPGLGPLPPRRG